MSDPTAAKRLRAEARATCAALEEAARKLKAWATAAADDGHAEVPTDLLHALSNSLAHQGGRLDMAVQMAHTRRKK